MLRSYRVDMPQSNPKTVLLGATDNLPIGQLIPWAASARDSGFAGDIWLVVYRPNWVEADFEAFCAKYDINVYPVDHDSFGNPIQHSVVGSPTSSHNLRFYHFWELLTRLKKDGVEYKYVLSTDTRDVVFQKDPSEHILECLELPTGWSYIISSEQITYDNEEWGKNNIIQGFGQLMYDLHEMGDKEIFNVGVIAGKYDDMVSLYEEIYNYTHDRKYYPSDQSSYNYILLHRWGKFSSSKYAIQCGTTMDPTKSFLWKRIPHYEDIEPQIKDGKVYTADNILSAIVHQWDRVPELVKIITEKYNVQDSYRRS